jgi:hypothetical protein
MIADIVLLTACVAAAVLLGLYAPKMRQQWRNARGVIELTEREAAHGAPPAPTRPAWPGACARSSAATGCAGDGAPKPGGPGATWTCWPGDLTSIKREGQW